MDEKSNWSPAAAVPVSVKIPAPITEPMPSATRLHSPRWRRSRPECASLAEINSAIDLVRVRLGIECLGR